jgi:SAM-dependent methyltransferase
MTRSSVRPVGGAADWYDRYWTDGVSGWRPAADISGAMRRMLTQECAGRSVLDFGGGDGARYGEVIRASADRYVVADVSPHVLAHRAELGDSVVRIDQLADLDERFDVVIALEVLEHVLDPVAALSTAVEVLRAGGRAIVSVPNAFSWWNRLRMLFGRLPASGVGPPGVQGRTYEAPHIRFYDLVSLRNLIANTGMESEEICTDSVELGRFAPITPDRLWHLTPRRAILASTLIVRCRKP